MAHRVAPSAEADLDDIWFHVAKESGSIEIANRLIDTVTERFLVLASHISDVRARKTSALDTEASRWGNTSSCTASKTKTR